VSLYALARVGRAGLGNSLFPWARAELFSLQSGAQMLAPRWTSVRIGPYLRQEPEKRRYGGFFRAPHHRHGLSRTLVAALGSRLSETQIDQLSEPSLSPRPRVVEFRGLGNLFEPLAGKHDYIHRQLWQMTLPSLRPDGRQYAGKIIAMHVRRGDLTRQGYSQQQLRDEVVEHTPLSWFAGMARAVRRERSLHSIPIVVFTDGSEDELADLLAIDGVRLHARQAAISDLWALTHAQLLFASGFSTFSMWASFLGSMPTIYAPGKIQQKVQTGRSDPVEIELDERADIPALVLAAIGR
jgi:hypothetical protein